LVNGSLGKIIGFMSEMTYTLCQSEGIDAETALDWDSNSASKDDPYGFATLDPENNDSDSVQRKKRKILKLRAMSAENSTVWPLVRFTTAAGHHIGRLITREKWSFELPDGEVQAYRRQIPLILAYAISIHKAQGQTLSRVRVDLGKVFERGQAYVALSRATSRDGLQIKGFNPSKVMAHPKVAGFYASLEGIEGVRKDYVSRQESFVQKARERLSYRDMDEEAMEEIAYG
jgi:ATP-dependent DNA helicase PIF1